MKVIYSLFLMLFMVGFSFAQQAKTPKIPDFDAKKFLGVITYFNDEVVEATKLKDKANIATVKDIITSYNLKVEEVTLLKKDLMDISEINLNQQIKSYELNKDERAFRSSIQKTSEALAPLRTEIETIKKSLDTSLKQALKKKQFKKWLKFKKKKWKELYPIPDNAHRDNSPIQRSQSPFNRNNRNSRLRGY